ncbi:MAG: ParB/RepB/Spo0J family partition protein [bacterium]|nr:ParB/RepB/Spo0J family partition protein [bacterium]
MQRIALGKGLEALLPEVKSEGENIREVKISEIQVSRYQPRRYFDPEKQKELADSIREKGVIQPILLRPSKEGYELIAGERRLQAARSIGLDRIPAVVKDVVDSEALEIALIENIQREDLNPMEEADAYQRLIREFGLTQENLAKEVGKDRTSVTNTLRLLKLPIKIQEQISNGSLSMGHARAILSLESEVQQLETCERVIKKGLSVREVESLVKRMKKEVSPQVDVSRETSQVSEPDVMLVACEEDLMRVLGTKIRIRQDAKGGGKIEIEFYSLEDLDRIMERIVPRSDLVNIPNP